MWLCLDFSEGQNTEKFSARFATAEQADEFAKHFAENCKWMSLNKFLHGSVAYYAAKHTMKRHQLQILSVTFVFTKVLSLRSFMGGAFDRT